MKQIDLYGKNNHEVKTLLKVFSIPKNFDYDEEEKGVISSEIEQLNAAIKEGTYSKAEEKLMVSGSASMALAKLAERKLSEHDFKKAFSSCIKSLAVFDAYENNWLLLAEILAMYGSSVAANRCLEYAVEVHRKNGEAQPELMDGQYKQIWEEHIKRVKKIIDK